MNGDKKIETAGKHVDVAVGSRRVIRAARRRLAVGVIAAAVATVAINARIVVGDMDDATTQPTSTTQPMVDATTTPSNSTADATTAPSNDTADAPLTIFAPTISDAATAPSNVTFAPTTLPSNVADAPSTAPNNVADAPSAAPDNVADAPSTAPNTLADAPSTAPSDSTASANGTAAIVDAATQPTTAPSDAAATEAPAGPLTVIVPGSVADDSTTAPTTAPTADVTPDASSAATAPSVAEAPATAPTNVALTPTTAPSNVAATPAVTAQPTALATPTPTAQQNASAQPNTVVPANSSVGAPVMDTDDATMTPATQPSGPMTVDVPPATPGASSNATAPTPDANSADSQASIMKGEPNIVMQVNKSRVIETLVPIHVVSIAQPDIANFQVIGANTLLLNALKPGNTQLILWDDQNHSQIVNIDVEMDLVDLRAQLKSMFPDSGIVVTAVNGCIALSGRVPSLEVADRAVQIASPYCTKILNFMEISGGTQVMLHVRFAEIGRSVNDAFGFNADATDGSFSFGDINGPGNSPTGGLAAGTLAGSSISSDVALFASGGVGRTRFELFLEALRQNSLVKTLAEPDLITESGQEADFLAGGEFPVPVPQTSGGGTSITVDYKEYGVKLRFIPVVLGDGRIRMKVSPSVSALDDSTAVTFDNYVTPGLTERSVVTTVELAEGQTFAIAGLLQDNVNGTSNITPILGDLPIVGPLFRSVSYQRKETELLILVTPHLVNPMNPGQVPEVPGEHWRYPTEADIFWNHDLGGEAAATSIRPTMKPMANAPKFQGSYGFVPVNKAGTKAGSVSADTTDTDGDADTENAGQ